MASRKVPVPYSITQLQQQFEQFRTARTGRADEAARVVVAGGGGAGTRARSQFGCAHAAVGLRRAEEAAERSFDAASGDSAAGVRRADGGGWRAGRRIRNRIRVYPSPRMRVHWKGATPPDWAALLRAWRDVAG
jgi:hypothetical protein